MLLGLMLGEWKWQNSPDLTSSGCGVEGAGGVEVRAEKTDVWGETAS